MKKFKNIKSIVLATLITGLLIFSTSFYLLAQDSGGPGQKNGVVRLKIKKDNNGKTTVTDTTFTITNPSDHKVLEEYLKNYEEELKDLDEELKNIEVFVDIPDFPDSLATDSIKKHIRIVENDFRTPRFRYHNQPGEFDYEFDIPFPPGVPPPPLPGDEDFEGEYPTHHNMRLFRYDNERQTLSDILGDIPMDRVKSYSVKDRKNGKRIIIDIEDAPLMENHKKVIKVIKYE